MNLFGLGNKKIDNDKVMTIKEAKQEEDTPELPEFPQQMQAKEPPKIPKTDSQDRLFAVMEGMIANQEALYNNQEKIVDYLKLVIVNVEELMDLLTEEVEVEVEPEPQPKKTVKKRRLRKSVRD